MAKKILIVDDDASMRELLRRVLEHPIFEIATAATVREADAYLAERKPDLAIIDLVMPGGSGAELMRRLASAEKPAKLIVISALASLFRSRNEVPPEVSVVAKPFTIKDMRRLVFDKLDIVDPRRSSYNDDEQ